jgi:hypothetical protein
MPRRTVEIRQALAVRRAAHRTQWAAQFAVASELCKRGYEVSFTMGNSTPLADLMVVSPESKQMFLVDVKGLYRKNPWLVRPTVDRHNLFFVFAFVPDDGVNRFFVLTQKTVNDYIRVEIQRLGREEDYSRPGILWKQVEPHEDSWGVLPK